jgi:periplasmic protein TonB
MHEVCEATKHEEETKSFETVAAPGNQETAERKGSENRPGVKFDDLLLENPHLKRPRRWIDVLVSLAGQAAFIIFLILIPLYYTQGLNIPKFEKTFLISPPPPPPPPPSAPEDVMVRPKVSLFDNGRLVEPKAIPKHVAIVKEQAPEPSSFAGVAGGVPGGVPGGTLGGVLGGVLSSGNQPLPAAPRRPVSHAPLRVGGNVQAPRLVRNVQPTYPALARETRVQGTVVLDCVIDEHGNVTELKLVSGHPLLVGAAMEAVRQWKYQPTLLNGQAVAVEMHVNVHFSLGGY